jgi:hypothetical protein
VLAGRGESGPVLAQVVEVGAERNLCTRQHPDRFDRLEQRGLAPEATRTVVARVLLAVEFVGGDLDVRDAVLWANARAARRSVTDRLADTAVTATALSPNTSCAA